MLFELKNSKLVSNKTSKILGREKVIDKDKSGTTLCT